MTMEQPDQEHCEACGSSTQALTSDRIAEYLVTIPGWSVVEENGEKQLRRTFTFEDFNHAMEFTNKLWKLAESEDHHPAILTEWGKVTVSWWTHAIGGLHRNDFVMASRTDLL
jgi:4a-hydroxytetrahydrobiopterin dehydratase